MTEEFISIVVPTYNRAKYLDEALDSAIRQNYTHYEIIVSDNGSTDETDTIIEKYMQYPQLKHYKNETNLGPIKNLHRLVHEYATGAWVFILCDDDVLIDVDFLKKANEIIQKNDQVKVVHGNVYYYYEADRNGWYSTYAYDEVTDGVKYFLEFRSATNKGICGTQALFHRETAIKLGAFSKDIKSSDTSLWLRLLLEGDVGFISNPVTLYRYHETNDTYKKDSIDRNLAILSDIDEIYYLAKVKIIDESAALEEWYVRMLWQLFYWSIENCLTKEQIPEFIERVYWLFPALHPYVFKP